MGQRGAKTSGDRVRPERRFFRSRPCNGMTSFRGGVLGETRDGAASGVSTAAGPPRPTDEDDGLLLGAVAQGDHRAFRLLMQRHLPRVLRVAQRMTRNPDDADEIAQEAFLKVWTGASRWRPDGQAQFKTWLYRVVINQCIDRNHPPACTNQRIYIQFGKHLALIVGELGHATRQRRDQFFNPVRQTDKQAITCAASSGRLAA